MRLVNTIGSFDRQRCRWSGLCLCMMLVIPAATLGAPPLDALIAPQYSFDVSSPSAAEGFVIVGDILSLEFPHPATELPGTMLGLWTSMDDLDALSSANASVWETDVFSLMFSVDRDTLGAVPPDSGLVLLGVPYNVTDQSERGHAAGDQFFSTEVFTREGLVEPPEGSTTRNNFLVRNNFDEGGTDFSAYPSTHASTVLEETVPQDGIDATARLVLNRGDGTIASAYFSVTPESPSLEMLSGAYPPSGAHVFFASGPSYATGACCFEDDTCTITSPQDCLPPAGEWLGPDTTCDLCDIPQMEGACCFEDGTCEILGPEDCFGTGGYWPGPDTTCDMCEPPLSGGACCFEDGTCDILGPNECAAAGAFWLGPDTTCDMCELPPIEGACCFEDSTCEILSIWYCWQEWGWWLGPDTTCDACDYPPAEEGACCFDDETCGILTEPECCGVGGWWLGPGATCDMCNPPEGDMVVSLYACNWELGLLQTDDIDALIVFDTNDNGLFDGSDQVLFSLSPGSPSLDTIPGATPGAGAADIFTVTPGQAAAVFVPAVELGLGASPDNIDALDFHTYSDASGSESSQAWRHGIRSQTDTTASKINIDSSRSSSTSGTPQTAPIPRQASTRIEDHAGGRPQPRP